MKKPTFLLSETFMSNPLSKTQRNMLHHLFDRFLVTDDTSEPPTAEEFDHIKGVLEDFRQRGYSMKDLLDHNDQPMTLSLVESNQFELLKLLVSHGGDLHAIDCVNNNALQLAGISGDGGLATLNYCLDSGVDPNHINHFGHAPLACVISHFSDLSIAPIEAIQKLLDHGANINHRSHLDPSSPRTSHCTALQWAIDAKSLDIVQYLMQQPELEIYDVNGQGDSALHLAAAYGDLQIVQFILQTGLFDLDQTNQKGLTPHLLAEQVSYDLEVKSYLKEAYLAHAERKTISQIMGTQTVISIDQDALDSEPIRKTQLPLIPLPSTSLPVKPKSL